MGEIWNLRLAAMIKPINGAIILIGQHEWCFYVTGTWILV